MYAVECQSHVLGILYRCVSSTGSTADALGKVKDTRFEIEAESVEARPNWAHGNEGRIYLHSNIKSSAPVGKPRLHIGFNSL